jgi:hypothetical protein
MSTRHGVVRSIMRLGLSLLWTGAALSQVPQVPEPPVQTKSPELVTQTSGSMLQYGITAAFGPSGRWLMTLKPNFEGLLYDIVGGRVSRRFENVTLFAVHPALERMAIMDSGSMPASLMLYDVNQGVVVWKQSVAKKCEALHFSSDGSRVFGLCAQSGLSDVGGIKQGNLAGWDSVTGTEVKMPVLADGYVAGSVFSEDGRWVLGGKPIPSYGTTVGPGGQKKTGLFAYIKIANEALKAMKDRAILDTATGQIVAHFSAFITLAISARTHKALVLGVIGQGNPDLMLVDLLNPAAKPIVVFGQYGVSAQVSIDGKHFLVTTAGNTMLVDADTGAVQQPNWGSVPFMAGAAMARDSDQVAFVQSGSVMLTRISMPGEKRTIGSTAPQLLMTDGSLGFYGASTGEAAAKQSSIQNDSKARVFTGAPAAFPTIASGVGSTLKDMIPVYGTIRMRQRAKETTQKAANFEHTSQVSTEWRTQAEQDYKHAVMTFGGPMLVPAVSAFLDSGRLMAVRAADASWGLWDVATGNHMALTNTFSFDGANDRTPEMWLNWNDLNQIEKNFGSAATNESAQDRSQDIANFAYSPDRQQTFRHSVLSIVEDDAAHSMMNPEGFGITVRNASDNKVMFEIPEALGNASLITVAPSGKVLVGADRFSTMGIWNRQTGERLGTLYAYQEGEWLLTTPSGLFDGSPRGWEQIAWRDPAGGNATLPGEAFFSEFYRPGLLADLLEGQVPQPPRTLAQIDRRQPAVTLTSAEKSTSKRSVDLHLDLVEAGSGTGETPGGLRDVRLFRNGVLVKVWHGKMKLAGGRFSIDVKIPLIAGENRFVAYAFNDDNVKSMDAKLSIVCQAPAEPRTAYILAVGVDQYSNAEFNLNFAAADAEHFGEQLTQSLKLVGEYEQVVHVNLLNADATKSNLLQALNILGGHTTSPSTAPTSLAGLSYLKPQDTVVLYFAGHGLASEDHFYLIPHDLGFNGPRAELPQSLNDVLTHGISDAELEDAFEAVDAANILLVIDACSSGKALDAEEQRRGPMNSKGLAQLAYEKGMYVLTASQAYQAALESSKLGHGYLTYALTEEALRTKLADTAPADGEVSVTEWFEYAARRVPQMQSETLNLIPHEGERQLSFEMSAGKISTKPSGLQTPRLYYRREQQGQKAIIHRIAPTS